MDEQSDSATPLTRTRKRRQGQHPSAEEKRQEQERFLEAFAKTGNVLLACRSARVDKSSIYRWAEHDEHFALRKNQAERDFFWIAHAEFVRRAIQGYEEIVTNNQGIIYQKDGTPLKRAIKSDRLLEMIIKRGFPEYREKLEHTGQGGGPLQVEVSYVNDWRSNAAPEDTPTDAPQRTNRRS